MDVERSLYTCCVRQKTEPGRCHAGATVTLHCHRATLKVFALSLENRTVEVLKYRSQHWQFGLAGWIHGGRYRECRKKRRARSPLHCWPASLFSVSVTLCVVLSPGHTCRPTSCRRWSRKRWKGDPLKSFANFAQNLMFTRCSYFRSILIVNARFFMRIFSQVFMQVGCDRKGAKLQNSSG